MSRCLSWKARLSSVSRLVSSIKGRSSWFAFWRMSMAWRGWRQWRKGSRGLVLFGRYGEASADLSRKPSLSGGPLLAAESKVGRCLTPPPQPISREGEGLLAGLALLTLPAEVIGRDRISGFTVPVEVATLVGIAGLPAIASHTINHRPYPEHRHANHHPQDQRHEVRRVPAQCDERDSGSAVHRPR